MADKVRSEALKKSTVRGGIVMVVLFAFFWLLSLLQENPLSADAFHRAAFFSIIIAAGYTIYAYFTFIRRTERGRKFFRGGTALGILIACFGFWMTLAAFNEFRVWPGRFAMVLLCGIIGFTVSRLAAYKGDREGGLWWGLTGWLADRTWLKFSLGLFIGLYIVYLHPFLKIVPDSMVIIEWTFFGILTFVIFFRVWMGINRDSVEDGMNPGWGRHKPQTDKLTGSAHDYLIRVERQFINTGETAGLYVALIPLLYESKVDEEDIIRSVEPLVHFRGVNELQQTNLRLSPREEYRQEKLRKDVLQEVFGTIDKLISRNRFELRSARETGLTLQELERQFLEQEVKSGLLVRLTILLYRSGRHQEHITSIIRSLTDANGHPDSSALKSLLNSLNTGEATEEGKIHADASA